MLVGDKVFTQLLSARPKTIIRLEWLVDHSSS
jgi:hypothetical protein